MLIFVALAEQNFDLERLMTRGVQVIVEDEVKIHVARSAALSAQHSDLTKAVEMHKCRGTLKDPDERLGLA